MEAKKKLELVGRNTSEIIVKDELQNLFSKKAFNFYCGVAPTGPVHIGYLVPFGKFVDCANAGGDGTVLIADYHAYLDDRKTPWDELKLRSQYYQKCLEILLKNVKDKTKFVLGSSYQSSREFVDDLYQLSSITTVQRAIRAAAEVVRIENPKVGSLIYPIMQSLDVKYLKADAAIGGTDQRHIFALSRELLHEVGWKKPTVILSPLIMSLKGPGQKMSASIPGSHIKVHETEGNIKSLVESAYCPAKVVQDNPVLQIATLIIIPFLGSLQVIREKKFGGDVEYANINLLESEYSLGKLHPKDLKSAVCEGLRRIISPVRKYFDTHESFANDVAISYKWPRF